MKLLFPLVGAAFLLVAPPAHADVDAFTADLQAKGVPFVAINGTPILRPAITGPRICSALQGGMSYDTAIQQFPPLLAPWAPTIVSSAQHNLCPDTLH